MTLRRLCLISRRFWPLSGELEILAGNLAQQLTHLGHQVTVVSAGLVKQWPDEFRMERIAVKRIPLAARRLWATPSKSAYDSRWCRRLQRLLHEEQANIDAVIAMEFPSDHFEISQQLSKSGIPSVVRLDAQSIRQMHNRMAKAQISIPSLKNRLEFVVANEYDRHLAASWLPLGANLHIVPDGIVLPRIHDRDQWQIRRELTEAHQVLALEAQQPMAVSTAAFTFDSGVFQLVRAWRTVVSSKPDAKLWLIGSGDAQRELFQRISDLDLTSSILFPGDFDEIRDVLGAANLYIMPGDLSHMGIFALEAHQLGLPIVCRENSPAGRQLETDPSTIRFNEHGRQLAKAILKGFNLERKQGLSPTVVEIPSIEQMAVGYLELINQLCGSRTAATYR